MDVAAPLLMLVASKKMLAWPVSDLRHLMVNGIVSRGGFHWRSRYGSCFLEFDGAAPQRKAVFYNQFESSIFSKKSDELHGKHEE